MSEITLKKLILDIRVLKAIKQNWYFLMTAQKKNKKNNKMLKGIVG